MHAHDRISLSPPHWRRCAVYCRKDGLSTAGSNFLFCQRAIAIGLFIGAVVFTSDSTEVVISFILPLSLSLYIAEVTERSFSAQKMYTTRDPPDILVLKTAVFNTAATRADPKRCIPHRLNKAKPTKSDEPLSSPPAAATPSFSFSIPTTASLQGEAPVTAHLALQQALQRHETALRKWADLPLEDQQQHDDDDDVARGEGSSFPSALHHHRDRRCRSSGGKSDADPRCRASSSRASGLLAALTQPYSRVLANASIGAIGMPQYPRIRKSGHGAAPIPEAVSKNSADTAAGPSLYQVPLRLVAPSPQPPHEQQKCTREEVTGAATTTASPAAVSRMARLNFAVRQQERYASFNNRYSARLHRLAPDMWGRALPSYAALDRHPRVMDFTTHNFSSVVQREVHDNGVVLVHH